MSLSMNARNPLQYVPLTRENGPDAPLKTTVTRPVISRCPHHNGLLMLGGLMLLLAGVACAAPVSQPDLPDLAKADSTDETLTNLSKDTRQSTGDPGEFRQSREEQPLPQSHQGDTISIVQQQTEPVDPLLRDAWLAYQNGKFDEARQRYLALFRKDAHNPDVLLGLAAIAQQHGESLLAAHYFSRVLALEPRNALAHAGLSSLSTGDENSESRLKILLREQENSAALHFALGNIYAGQSRWSEAQQAYFNAYMLEPGNAGFAFNLAISLDHLGQSKLAVQHYQRTLTLGPPHGAGLDHAQISQRIDTLARDENDGRFLDAP